MQGQQQGYGMVNNQMPGQQPPYAMNVEGGHRHGNKHGHHQNQNQEWSSGLCGCCSDCGSCCLTMFCPCVQYGLNYEKVHNSGCCTQGFVYCLLAYCGLSCCVHKELRHDVRHRYGIKEGCSDCLTTCFCSACAICQEARELKN